MSNCYTTTTRITNEDPKGKSNNKYITIQQQNDIKLNNCLPILVEISWQKVVGNNERIFLSQLRNLFNEMEKILKINSIFNAKELNLIESFIITKPTYRLNKKELVKFILKSIHLNSFENLLVERFQFDDYYIAECINNALNGVKNNTNSIKNEYYENRRNAWSSNSSIKEKNSNETSGKIMQLELNELKKVNKNQEKELRSLRLENEKLNDQIFQLIKKTSSTNELNDSSNSLELAEQRLKIKELTNQCETYKLENELLKENEAQIIKSVETLEGNILKQDKLIEYLKQKLPIEKFNQTNHKVLNFIKKIPYLKSYYYKLNTTEDLKDTKIFVLFMFSIFAIFTILLSTLQLIITLTRKSNSNNIGYVYDNYSSESENNLFWRLSIATIGQLPYIEKLMYDIIDW
ncbi:hypothetical protein KGF54_002799 [Candida jiufengensis]|uniref:uncharacterized protein n=1 Tax=Candida jiufengensis TaxID=497108 RepID=UPI0022251535|nr:uncharacterized protein KGF54_002799 [Candida jiufengensis]KAI5953427.1 hypothetical protein KGF54_002799 [Candida jiufengensis]